MRAPSHRYGCKESSYDDRTQEFCVHQDNPIEEISYGCKAPRIQGVGWWSPGLRVDLLAGLTCLLPETCRAAGLGGAHVPGTIPPEGWGEIKPSEGHIHSTLGVVFPGAGAGHTSSLSGQTMAAGEPLSLLGNTWRESWFFVQALSSTH